MFFSELSRFRISLQAWGGTTITPVGVRTISVQPTCSAARSARRGIHIASAVEKK